MIWCCWSATAVHHCQYCTYLRRVDVHSELHPICCMAVLYLVLAEVLCWLRHCESWSKGQDVACVSATHIFGMAGVSKEEACLFAFILQHLPHIPRGLFPASISCCLDAAALTQHPEQACMCAKQHTESGHEHARLWRLISPHLQEGLAFGAKLAAAGGKVDVALNRHQVVFMVPPNTAGVIHHQGNGFPAF